MKNNFNKSAKIKRKREEYNKEMVILTWNKQKIIHYFVNVIHYYVNVIYIHILH